jgi:Smg-4/UPF3 family
VPERILVFGCTYGYDVQRLNRENVHSRAYIAFKTEELVAKFCREYDGHIFKDKAGVYMLVLLSMLTQRGYLT